MGAPLDPPPAGPGPGTPAGRPVPAPAPSAAAGCVPPGFANAPRPPRGGTRRLAVVAGLLVLAIAVVLGVRACSGGGGAAPGTPEPLERSALAERVQEATSASDEAGEDAGETALEALRWREDENDELQDRATLGFSQPLFTLVPGGAEATARRVQALRPRIEAAARRADEDPDVLEAIVYLESAGRPGAMATDSVEDASGLVQIVAETGTSLLGMDIDLAASRSLTKRIRRGRGDVAALERRRARVDPRFNPEAALAAAARYLDFARGELGGRDDLAITSYHMGVGNLQSVLARYEGGAEASETPYVQLYFDSDPANNPGAWRRLQEFADDSATYWWRILAAQRIMRMSREEPGRLREEAALRTRKASAEELLQPAADAPSFADPAALADAQGDGRILPLPRRVLRTNGIAVSPAMGELAGRLDQRRTRYRGLRPGALATLVTIGAATQELSGTSPLAATSTVRDERYQRLLQGETIQATSSRSLHATGWALDVGRDYRSPAQSLRFQFVLDRLRALNLVAWVREPEAIHLTPAPETEQRLGGVLRVALGG